MKLTKEEKELIEKKRQEKINLRAQRKGFLKENFYFTTFGEYDLRGRQFSKTEYNNIIADFARKFKMMPVGTRFCSYIDNNGVETWYDDDLKYGLQGMEMSSKWGEENLINIKPIVYKKKVKKTI